MSKAQDRTAMTYGFWEFARQGTPFDSPPLPCLVVAEIRDLTVDPETVSRAQRSSLPNFHPPSTGL